MEFAMKKWKKIGSNAIDGATTTNKDWGFRPVPNKGGKTTNTIIYTKED
jgi:hypothetical protein